MAKNQSARRSDQEWFDIITECRQSGLSDTAWCKINGIPTSSFSTAARRLRKKAFALPSRSDVNVNPFDFTSKQEVVKVDVVRDSVPGTSTGAGSELSIAKHNSLHLDNSHTIEIQLGTAVIRLSNDADPELARLVAASVMEGCHYAR